MFDELIAQGKDMIRRLEPHVGLVYEARKALPAHQQVAITEAVAWQQAVEERIQTTAGTDALTRYTVFRRLYKEELDRHEGDEVDRALNLWRRIVALLCELRDRYNSNPSGSLATMRILFLAANPTQTAPLDLEEELRGLEQELRGVKFRNSIRLSARHAVRPDDLIRHVREEKPNVIHFSGHGSTTGIVLRNDTGGFQEVEGVSLKRFLEGRGVDLVVLNACYSRSQADTIQGAVKTVVGTTDAVEDEAARRFTVAFYRSLGDGLSVREAFRDAGDAVALHGLIDVFHSDGDLGLVLVGEGNN